MTDRVYNIPFLCLHSSARSILAEGLMRSVGRGLFKTYSAGSHPSGSVHPLALILGDGDDPRAPHRPDAGLAVGIAGPPGTAAPGAGHRDAVKAMKPRTRNAELP